MMRKDRVRSVLEDANRHADEVEEIDLTGENLDEDDLQELLDALEQNETTIKGLMLKENRLGQLSRRSNRAQGGESIRKMLSGNLHLVTIDLSANGLGVSGGKQVALGLKDNAVLTDLNLDINNLGPDGARFIMELLKTNSTLNKLSMKYNKFGATGAKHLRQGLAANHSLKELLLDCNGFEGEGGKEIAEALHHNTSLTSLDLYGNRLGPDGGRYIGIMLRQNRCLKHLNLKGNRLGVEGGQEVGKSLPQNETLATLDISWNDLGPQGAKQFAQALQTNTTLENLEIRERNLMNHTVQILRKLVQQTRTVPERLELLQSLLFCEDGDGEKILSERALRLAKDSNVLKVFLGWACGDLVTDEESNRALDLSLWKCMPISGDLKLTEQSRISRLPKELSVRYNMDLSSCVSLRALPEKLSVGGNLILANCTRLTSLPSSLSVGGDVNLECCSGISSLPQCMFEWDGAHTVFLGGSGLHNETMEQQLGLMSSEDRLRFQFAMEDQTIFRRLDDLYIFHSLSEAISYWYDVANIDEEQALDLHIPQYYLRNVLMFLGKLRQSKEFVIQETRQDLARRIIEVLRTLSGSQDENASEQILIRMVDSVDRCDDKPIWALNQMTMISLISQAQGDRSKMKDLGRRVMNLDIVHKHARQKCDSIQVVDDVCVYLKFEIELREALDLPVSALNMHFPDYVKISSAELNKVKEEVESVSDEAFEVWLATWPPWQRQQRYDQACTLHYDELEKRKSTSWRQSLRNVFGEKVVQPVRLNRNQWSFPDLIQHWIETGCDLNNSRITFEQLKNNLKR